MQSQGIRYGIIARRPKNTIRRSAARPVAAPRSRRRHSVPQSPQSPQSPQMPQMPQMPQSMVHAFTGMDQPSPPPITPEPPP